MDTKVVDRRMHRVVPILILVLATSLGCQRSIRNGKVEIQYVDVKPEEAQSAADFLERKQLIAADRPATVKIDRQKDLAHSPPTFRVHFFLKEGAWNDKDLVAEFQQAANEMKPAVFHGEQTIFVLASVKGIEQKKLYAQP